MAAVLIDGQTQRSNGHVKGVNWVGLGDLGHSLGSLGPLGCVAVTAVTLVGCFAAACIVALVVGMRHAAYIQAYRTPIAAGMHARAASLGRLTCRTCQL